MNSRNNSDKESKQGGWGRRDNRQQRFKKDFSSQDFYNQDWKQNKNKKQNEFPNQSQPHAPQPTQPKTEKFNVSENYSSLVSTNFKWINFCQL